MEGGCVLGEAWREGGGEDGRGEGGMPSAVGVGGCSVQAGGCACFW